MISLMHRRSFCAACILMLGAVVGAFCVLVQPALAEPVQRKVLAIYDSAREPQSSQTSVHYLAEMPFNHLGYIVDYHDVRTSPLPDLETMANYRAVVTWFTYDLERPTEYLEWAAKVSESGVRFIIIGSFGGRTSYGNMLLLNRVLGQIGVRYTGDYAEITAGSVVTYQDDEIVGFERPLDPILPDYPIVERISSDARIALEVQAPANKGRRTSALVVTGPGGAFVVPGYDLYYDPQMQRSQWIVNPFALFSRALGEELFPVPDTTTVSGRRLYFSHVDGDGWNNLVEMDRYRNPPVASADVMRRELIEPYPDLPVSVGLVAGDLDPVLGGGERAKEIARQIFALPQVEVASHTHTHPFDWGFYENYDRDRELAALPAVPSAPKEASLMDRLSAQFGLNRQPTEREAMQRRYMSGGKVLPRAYMRDPFGLGLEVGEAVRMTEELAPAGKTAALYQWSGDTRAFESILKATRRAGLRNINGGDTRFDDEYPSVSYVAALSRVDGSERQIYAVNSNENTYTNEWTEHFQGFLSLSETLRRTESPRRLKGVNVYYHTFSAEKQASLSAIRAHLDWAKTAHLTPIKASDYAAIADGFFSTTIEKIAPGSWRVSNRDGLHTLRFDNAEELEVDLASSDGVVGQTWHAGSLYIALDKAVADATVTIRDRQDDGISSENQGAILDNSRWLVSNLDRDYCSLRYHSSGYGNGAFVWEGMRPGVYRLEAMRGSDRVWHATATAAQQGRLSFEINADAIDGLDISVMCADRPGGV